MSIPSRTGGGPNPDILKAGDDRAEIMNPWEKSLALLSDEDKKQFNTSSDAAPLSMLDVLKSKPQREDKRSIKKGWTVYRNKNGEEVKLLHILQKMSTWVKEAMKIVDMGISFDQSGHATLPWAIVKLITEVGFSSIEVFGSIVEGIELVSGLITRYAVVEKLYLHQRSESTPRLHEAITKLYANVLTYLSNVKAYYMGNTWKKIARSLKEAVSKQCDDLRSNISETEVEKWTHLVDAELQRAREVVSFKDHLRLREILVRLNKPIIQMGTQISMIQDRLNSDERTKVFHWMSKIEYKHHHDDLSKGLLAQSGQWLLESKPFIEWGQSSVSFILWLHGIPGSGKTRLVSMVINTINDATQNSSTSPTAFFFSARNTAEPERAKPAAIMSAFLRQLASSQSDIPIKKAVVEEYEARKNLAAKDGSALKKLTVEDCTRLIVELANSHPLIDQTETYGRDLATQTLKWLLCCQRLLTAEELIAAVYKVDEDIFSDSDEDSERLEQDAPLTSPENDILRLCRNLVVFDSEQRLFRFSHQFVREYLLKQPQYTAAEQHNLAAKRCLDIYLTEHLQISINPEIEQSNNVLRRYAELYWPVHFKYVEGSQSTQLQKSVSRFISPMQGKSIPYEQWRSGFPSNWQDRQIGLPNSEPMKDRITFVAREEDTLLAVASAFGIPYFLQVHESLENPSHQYLAFAAKQGNDQIVQLLLDKGAEVEPRRESGRKNMNALEEACKNGYEYIVRLLLDSGADINTRYGRYGSALRAASMGGNYQIVQMLLDRGVDINLPTEQGGTALQAASGSGHYQIVGMLLNRGADINARSGYYGTALQAASSNGHCQIVQMLLNRGADINAQAGCYGTALQGASYTSYYQIVKMLLDRGADVNAQGGYHGTALELAFVRSHEQILQMLIARGGQSSISSRPP